MKMHTIDEIKKQAEEIINKEQTIEKDAKSFYENWLEVEEKDKVLEEFAKVYDITKSRPNAIIAKSYITEASKKITNPLKDIGLEKIASVVYDLTLQFQRPDYFIDRYKSFNIEPQDDQIYTACAIARSKGMEKTLKDISELFELII